jgi:hypothetical protein
MAYTITSDTVGLAIGPMLETANDVQEALNKAHQMCDTGFVNVSIKDEAGHQIEGDELLACIIGKRTLTEDLRAVWETSLISFSNGTDSESGQARQSHLPISAFGDTPLRGAHFRL